MKKLSAVFLSFLLLITLFGCAKEEAEPFQIPDNLHLDSKYSVVDGKLIYLTLFPQGGGTGERAAEIDNAVCVMANRFVFCSDGTVVDLYGDPDDFIRGFVDSSCIDDYLGKDITLSLVTGLYTTCGIRDITLWEVNFILYAGDGYCYAFERPALSYTKAEDPHIESDGSVFSEEYPELAEWTDVVELQRVYDDKNKQNVFIGLTSSGKVLSYGIDFTPENVVKIQVCYIPMGFVVGALTADGKLVFSEVPEPKEDGIGSPYGISLYDAVQQAKEFTDVEDFRITGFDTYDVVILVKKKDGTLHATTNNFYNPELVQSP